MSIRERARRPVDIASLAMFRILFGAVMFIGCVRLLASGWIGEMYGTPFAFKYPGFAWVEAWPVWGMYVHYVVLAGLALAIALGAWTRIALPLFVLGFTYTQLIDVTNYLNHHYLVVLLGAVLCFLPVHRAWSIDAWRDPSLRATEVPAWMVWLVRFQVGVVYVFAGLAKAHPDWLVHAQPLNIWLSARTDMPVVGPWLDERWVAYLMSWGGFLFDTTIVLWLSWRRTRLPAYFVLVGFHVAVGYLFNIGMFPLIMTTSALIFFSPSWPRRWIRDRAAAPRAAVVAPSPRRWVVALLAVHVVVQIALPLRHRVMPGDVLWNEDGMRFAWHVLVREKNGAVTFVAELADGRTLEVPPRTYLTPRQEREMSGQPDLIAQLARHIAADLRPRYGEVKVHALTHVSLNGRPAVPLIDPEVDLAHEVLVTQVPSTDPIHLRPLR